MLATTLILALSAAPLFAADSFGDLHIIPWGDKGGTVKQEVTASDRSFYTGPTSFRVGTGGDLFVLNTLGASLERLDAKGKIVSSYSLPQIDQYDAEMTCVDFCFAPNGEIYLLEQQSRSVLRLDKEGTYLGSTPIPMDEGAVFVPAGIECDGAGRVCVVNGFDNAVTRFTVPGGKLIGQAVSDVAGSLVMDGQGFFYGVEMTSPDSFEKLDVVRVDPFAGEREVLFSFNPGGDVAEVRVIGRDVRGNIMVELALGAAELPRSRYVHVFTPKGGEVGRFPIPARPERLTMLRSRAVADEGGVWAVRLRNDGFGLQYFPLKKQ